MFSATQRSTLPYATVLTPCALYTCAHTHQVLISGSGHTLDTADMRAHTAYGGGFIGGALDPTVKRFWRVLSAMSYPEKAALLKFVTSCSRPPPLGFEALTPQFTIHK
jgi:HECT-domain (ubiquitin-transferase)